MVHITKAGKGGTEMIGASKDLAEARSGEKGLDEGLTWLENTSLLI